VLLNAEGGGRPVSTLWLATVSSYWFSTSYKWFLVLVFLLPSQVADIVPGGDKSAYWGLIFSIGAVWAIIGPALFGEMSDRKGDRRPYIVLGCMLTITALAVLYLSNSILMLTVGYLLLQVSDDLATGPYSALIPELVPKDQRGRASGVMGLAMSLAQVVAVVTAIFLGESRIVLYTAIATLNVGGALIVVRVIGPGRKSTPSDTSFLKGWLEPWKKSDFRFVWMTRFFATLAFYFVIPYVNFYIRDVLPNYNLFWVTLKSPSEATGILALSMAIFGAVGSIGAGYLTDRWGRKSVTYLGATFMTLPLVAMLWLPDLSLIVLLSFLLGAGYGAFQTANWAMVADVLPDAQRVGRDMGIWQMSISSVQVIAGAAGLLVTYGNQLHQHLGYQALFGLAALAVVGGALASKKVRASS
jgi:MFS family permease